VQCQVQKCEGSVFDSVPVKFVFHSGVAWVDGGSMMSRAGAVAALFRSVCLKVYDSEGSVRAGGDDRLPALWSCKDNFA
jgi:hypothetical protein